MRTTLLATLTATLLTTLTLTAANPTQAQTPPTTTGWFGNWATTTQIDTYLQNTPTTNATPAIFWWKYNGPTNPLCTYTTGSACTNTQPTPWTNPHLTQLRTQLRNAGLDVYASYTDLDPTQTGNLAQQLTNPQQRNQLAKQLTTWATKTKVDGIDLDLENFAFNDPQTSWETTRPALTAFLKNLNKRLDRKNLNLSLTVPAGTRTFNGTAPVNSTGYWVYDWASNIQHVDQLRIMTYDYSWSVPGPIGPAWWARKVAESAVAQVGAVNAHKIYLGAPAYGRNWVLYDPAGDLILSEGCPTGWVPSVKPVRSTLSVFQARGIAAREGITPLWDATAGEWHFDYFWKVPGAGGVTCGVKRSIWWSDGVSVDGRLAAVSELGLGGVAVWELAALGASRAG